MNRIREEDLAQFSGSELFYRNPLFPRVIFTEGVEYLTENGCAWLIDTISSHIMSRTFNAAARGDPRIQGMHFWHLTVHEDRSAVLEARVDGDEEPFITQEIPFTDCPLDLDIWAAENEIEGQRVQTLMLPREY